MNSNAGEWATIVVEKRAGGRGRILNLSQRMLWFWGTTYYNHRLKNYPYGSRLNITIRISPTGRRMVQKIIWK